METALNALPTQPGTERAATLKYQPILVDQIKSSLIMSAFAKMVSTTLMVYVFNVQQEQPGTGSIVTVNHQAIGAWVSRILKLQVGHVHAWLDLLN
jgi:hypothetical protein